MTTIIDRPAILGGIPIRANDYPSWPVWDDGERDGLQRVLDDGGWWQGNGNVAGAFAAEFAGYHGARYGLALTNGTHTLEAALVACDVGDGDEVIVPGMTFVASAGAALAVNGKPVLVDIDPDTLCIDVAAAEAAITPRTKAIIAVHVAGAAADLDALTDLCARPAPPDRGLRARPRHVLARARCGFVGRLRQLLDAAIEADDRRGRRRADLQRRSAARSCVGIRRLWPGKGWVVLPPSHLRIEPRMTEWQGAVLTAQLGRFPEQNRVRNDNAVVLNAALDEIPGLRTPRRDPRMDSQGNYCFVFHYDSEQFAALPLRVFERALGAEGIPMSVSYPSLSDLDLFRNRNFAPRLRDHAPAIDYSTLHLPRAEHAAASTVWLQHRLLLANREDVLDVARAAARIQASAGEIVTRCAAGELS